MSADFVIGFVLGVLLMMAVLAVSLYLTLVYNDQKERRRQSKLSKLQTEATTYHPKVIDYDTELWKREFA